MPKNKKAPKSKPKTMPANIKKIIDRLTDKEYQYCIEYMKDFNKTQAAIRAGYSGKTACEIGYQNFTKLHILTFINFLKEERQKAYDISIDDIVNDFERVKELSLKGNKKHAFNKASKTFEPTGEIVYDVGAANTAITGIAKITGLLKEDSKLKLDLSGDIIVNRNRVPKKKKT